MLKSATIEIEKGPEKFPVTESLAPEVLLGFDSVAVEKYSYDSIPSQ